MTVYFADTSAFAKRYLPETGSAWVQTWIDPAAQNVIIISGLSVVEFISLLARRQREASVSPADFNRLKKDFLYHVRYQYRVIAVRQGILVQARELVTRYPLRTLDAIQLSTALVTGRTIGVSPLLVSADQKLLAAASSEHIPIDDPNAHP